MGSINQTSVNSYRTDVQIKVEDEAGCKGFLNYSLPFAITLAIEPGESIKVYFVRGGLQKSTAPGDFRLDAWFPFVAENTDTGQLIPITGVPTLGSPAKGLVKSAIVGALSDSSSNAWWRERRSRDFFSSRYIALSRGSDASGAQKYKVGLAESTRRAVAQTI